MGKRFPDLILTQKLLEKAIIKKNPNVTFLINFQTMQLKKKSKLVDQLNEAEILHKNTDRRASQVRSLLGKYLDEPDLREYDTFLVHLIKHITDLKETEQRIKLGEEQLVALNDNLITPPSPS